MKKWRVIRETNTIGGILFRAPPHREVRYYRWRWVARLLNPPYYGMLGAITVKVERHYPDVHKWFSTDVPAECAAEIAREGLR